MNVRGMRTIIFLMVVAKYLAAGVIIQTDDPLSSIHHLIGQGILEEKKVFSFVDLDGTLIVPSAQSPLLSASHLKYEAMRVAAAGLLKGVAWDKIPQFTRKQIKKIMKDQAFYTGNFIARDATSWMMVTLLKKLGPLMIMADRYMNSNEYTLLQLQHAGIDIISHNPFDSLTLDYYVSQNLSAVNCSSRGILYGGLRDKIDRVTAFLELLGSHQQAQYYANFTFLIIDDDRTMVERMIAMLEERDLNCVGIAVGQPASCCTGWIDYCADQILMHQ